MGGRKRQQLLANAIEVLTVLCGGLRSLAPVIGILLVFQFVVLGQRLENFLSRLLADAEG